jgi:hypothetical protein
MDESVCRARARVYIRKFCEDNKKRESERGAHAFFWKILVREKKRQTAEEEEEMEEF